MKEVLRLTEEPVSWAGAAWEELEKKLGDRSSYQRSIAVLVLCNLARSVSSERIRKTLPFLAARCRDEKFTTARQCLQNLWKPAAAHPSLAPEILDLLEVRFRDCGEEAHPNLMRRDIIQSLAAYGKTADPREREGLRERVRALIAGEPSSVYRKQYEKVLGPD